MKRHGAAIDAQFALVAAVRVDAREQFDERGFARAVFTAECVDFPGAQPEGGGNVAHQRR